MNGDRRIPAERAKPRLDKTYRAGEIEARQYARWEAAGAFAADEKSPRRPYAIMMPPPNVTGSLHMGHALNHTLQDILIRFHRMLGRDALWQPGTDHAGIATQMVVERQLAEQGKTRHDLGREKFIERTWAWKAQSGGTITRQLRRLGASPDWRRERFTMDDGLSAAVRKVFVDLHRAGLIYRDKRLVNWDPKLHTAISDLEVEAREVKGHLWYLKYPIAGADGAFIVVATTRPETLLGDTAVAVHPEDARYRHLIGRQAVLPVVGRKLPIVADETSDPEKGTGAVKITPAHDFNDFEVARRHLLPIINIFDADARMNDNAPAPYRGLDRATARARIVQALEAEGLIAKVEDHVHVVPHGDRSGVAIEPWLTDQWYCDAGKLAKPALAAVENGRTKFVPKHWENTYYEWMRNIQPWCISRQIWWGHRIPAWYGPDGKVFVELDEAAAQRAARTAYGKDVELERDPDVLDTWFSSALWPFSTLGWPEKTTALARYYPTDVLVTGFDIIFFWVARMMMMGLHFMGEVPFRTVYIHALVRDVQGQKMSKSKGNIIDPIELIDRYGCDALRFTLAALAAPGRDVKLSTARVEGYRNFATKLWNAARYCEMNGCVLPADFEPRRVQLPVHQWIMGELARAGRDVAAALEAYRFHEAAAALYRFTWGTFCDWYLEFTKPILGGADQAAKAECRAATGFVLAGLLKLLHPLIPFITEELWDEVGPAGAKPLIGMGWPNDLDGLGNAAAEAEMNWVVEAISAIRAVRAETGVPAAARLELLHKDASPAATRCLEAHRGLIETLARVARIAPSHGAVPKGAVQIAVAEATFILPLAGVIDAAAERARLEREIATLDDEIGRLDRKLANPEFVAKADPDIVEEQRERRAETAGARARLAAAVERLRAV
ncbi:MAG: valine--tRNA ligase [Pseudomonadota bacterium]